jgi:hypothetical protein
MRRRQFLTLLAVALRTEASSSMIEIAGTSATRPDPYLEALVSPGGPLERRLTAAGDVQKCLRPRFQPPVIMAEAPCGRDGTCIACLACRS